MKKNILIIVGLCAVCVLLSFIFDYQKPIQISREQASIAQPSQELPPFVSQRLGGDVFESSSLKGRVSLIHFWATWCPPCIVELPSLIEFATENPEIMVIALSTDFSEEAITTFLETRIHSTIPENFIILTDLNGEVTKNVFEVTRLPETILVSPDYQREHWWRGEVDWTDQEIRDHVLSLK